MQSEYITSAAKPEQLPVWDHPEFAFIGKSNCGKSSFINALTGRQNLARTSSTPGRTQMANFFSWNQSVILADLPGYGFNVAPPDVRKGWDTLISSYFSRQNIRGVFFLADCRRTPDKYEGVFLRSLAPLMVYVVLTKIDKVSRKDVVAMNDIWLKQCAAWSVPVQGIFTISTIGKKPGIEGLREFILKSVS